MNNVEFDYFELRKDVEKSTVYLSDDEDEQYSVNYKAKNRVYEHILSLKNKLEENVIQRDLYEKKYNELIDILAKNTGCAEDLEILEGILDKLVDLEVITENQYKDIVNSTSAGRWL